jgi:hypothetical protein
VDKVYNKKVRPRVFKEGDLILKKTLPTSREDQKKKVFFKGALILTRLMEMICINLTLTL